MADMNTYGVSGQQNPFISAKALGIYTGVILVLIAIFIFQIPLNLVFLGGVMILCPLLHIWMMKGGNHKH